MVTQPSISSPVDKDDSERGVMDETVRYMDLFASFFLSSALLQGPYKKATLFFYNLINAVRGDQRYRRRKRSASWSGPIYLYNHHLLQLQPDAGNEFHQLVEFQYVKREDMFIIKEIYSVDLSGWDWNWRNGQLIGRHKSARRSIYVVEILPYRQAKFTAVMYEGDDVQNAWEADFRQFSCPRKPGSTQLFGINRSEIAALIFHSGMILLTVKFQYIYEMSHFNEYVQI
ncbi:hypothetical protein WG66_008501 [Moniliophthora roreri]|nr:hypothetical protein WG66_008501 [Moniliophthora roreri]